MSTPGYAAYKLSFQLSPIILVNGIAAPMPGGLLPIIAITEAVNFAAGILSAGDNTLDLDDFFANFHPLPGASLIDQKLGEYPFANQAVAANAVIPQPLVISYRMFCPAQQSGGYAFKLATMMALQATLAQHNISGGTYTCATPSFFFTNCVMLGMRDTSAADSHQAQNTWQLDFRKPLLTLADAQQAQNNLMSRITNQTMIPGLPSWSGLEPTVGNQASVAGPSVVPAASGPAGTFASVPFAGPST